MVEVESVEQAVVVVGHSLEEDVVEQSVKAVKALLLKLAS